MRKAALLTLCATAVSFAQGLTIPDGTKVRVRLDQTISSATADEGQAVELSATESIKVNDEIVIPEGARVTGTVTTAQEKRRMGRAGKLDFSVDRVRAADGEWIPLRYTLNKKSGESHAARNGIITAGVAAVFWPAAPFVLLAKGKDVTINKGATFDVFTDADHMTKVKPVSQAPQPQQLLVTAAATAAPQGAASITVTSPVAGADIEVNGAFVGNTPTTLHLAAGAHTVTVRNGARVWQRVVQVTPGSTVTLQASFGGAKTVSN